MSLKNFIKSNKNNIKSLINKFVDNESAQDIEQEVYIKLWKTNNYEKNYSYIKTVVINCCKDFFKSKQYKQINQNTYDDAQLLNIADKKEAYDNVIDNKFRQKLIKKAVDKLPVKLREVVILFDIEGLNQNEISKKLNCPVGTIKSRLFKARKMLYEELKFLRKEK